MRVPAHTMLSWALPRPFGLLLSFAFVFAALPAEAQVLSLAEAERRALEGNPQLRVREARVAAATARIDGSRVESRPGLNLDVGLYAGPGSGYFNVQDADNPDRKYTIAGVPEARYLPQYRYAANLRYQGTLYDFGRTRARVDASEASAGAEASEARAERETIVRSVRTAYVAWYGAHQRRLLTQQAHEAARLRAEGLAGAVESGSRSALDRDSALVEAARLRLEVQRAIASENDARLALGLAVGQPIEPGAEPDPGVVDVEPPREALPVPIMAQALDLRREAAAAALRLYRLRHAPILTGGAQVSIAGQNSIVLPTYQVSVGLTVPLWDPRQRDHVASEARARAAEIEATEVAIRTTALSAEARARARYESAIQEVALAAEVVTLAQRAADGAEERWRVAGGTMDAALNARERERRAREELVKAQLDRTDAALRLVPVP